MRIGIITPYDSANCGAFLQAYASKIFLENQGHKVFFIKWRTDKERKKEYFLHSSGIKAKLRFLQKYFFLRERYFVMKSALKVFQVIDEEELVKYKIDCCIVGSDEVWNIRVAQFQNPIFYGKFNIKSIPCLAYAPSAGQAEKQDFYNFPEIIELFNRISIIGVRDLNTADIVHKILKRKVPLVCDPTCLLEIDKFMFPKVDIGIDKYILVYSYSVPKEHQQFIKRYAKDNKLKTVAVCMSQTWCDININCNPLEFNTYIANASCVYTTTFHGSIFTLLNHKACAIYAVSKKLKDLLMWTGKNDVIVYKETSYDQFSKLLNTTTNYLKFEETLAEFRKSSTELYISGLKKIEDSIHQKGEKC